MGTGTGRDEVDASGQPAVPAVSSPQSPPSIRWDDLCATAARVAARWNKDPNERQDIAQTAVYRLLIGVLHVDASEPTLREAWLCGIVRRVALERLRASRRLLRCRSGPPFPAHPLDPPEEAAKQELVRRLRSAVAVLPLPHAVIAGLRLREWTNRQIAAYLREWRGVGPDEAARLRKETLEMLRLAMEGIDLRKSFPKKFFGKNPWTTTPLPPPVSP
jgi:DNA-directed RNA polymerase specialized sigma24 family protein